MNNTRLLWREHCFSC